VKPREFLQAERDISFRYPYKDLIQKDYTILRLNELAKTSLIYGKFGPISSGSVMERTLTVAQRSIHMNPLDATSWYLLALASYALAIIKRRSDKWKASERASEIAVNLLTAKDQKTDNEWDALLFVHVALSDSKRVRNQMEINLRLYWRFYHNTEAGSCKSLNIISVTYILLGHRSFCCFATGSQICGTFQIRRCKISHIITASCSLLRFSKKIRRSPTIL
jgi:hypothetical protein